MRYPAYEKYNDSGVEWLGEVPEHWKVARIKFFFRDKGGAIKTGPFGSQLKSEDIQGGDVKIYNQRNVIQGDLTLGDDYIDEERFSDLKAFEVFDGDLLITTRGTIGRCAFVEPGSEKGILHPCLMRIQLQDEKLDYRYFIYLLQESRLLLTELLLKSNATTLEVIYSDTLKNLSSPIPPKSEQKRIVDFLNEKISQIDRLIRKKQSLIEKLNEKRTAMITQAVTKGLDANVPMKDSGVEWLGKVPEHWDLIRLSFVLSERLTNGIFKKAEEWGSGVRVINVFDVYAKNDVIRVETLDRLECDDEEQEKYSAIYGDFFFVRSSLKLEGVGKSAVVLEAKEKMVFECHLVRGRPDLKIINARFLNLFLNSRYSRESFVSRANTVTMATIDQNKFKDLKVCLPSLGEQKKIVQTVDKEINKIDALISHVTSAIEQLREYRTALITAAVTGKIKVT